MHRIALAAVVVASTRAAAQPPIDPVTWTAELEVTESFDSTSRTARGEIVQHQLAHVGLVAELVGPPPHDGRLHLKTQRARLIKQTSQIDFTRDARTAGSESHVAAHAEVQPEQIALVLCADNTDHFALRFELGLVTRGTNSACVNKACVDAPVPALPALGWVVGATTGATLAHDGDTWTVRYARDEAGRHREVTLVLRHTP